MGLFDCCSFTEFSDQLRFTRCRSRWPATPGLQSRTSPERSKGTAAEPTLLLKGQRLPRALLFPFCPSRPRHWPC